MNTKNLITCPLPSDMARRGSPVILKAGTELVNRSGVCSISKRSPGVVRGLVGALVDVIGDEDSALGDDIVTVSTDVLEMDLTDETGEQHAVSWCASRYKFQRRGAHLIWHATEGWMICADGQYLGGLEALLGRSFGNTKRARLLFLSALVAHLIAQREER